MEINATILVSTLSFLLFIFIMNAILYKPVMKIMEERQNYIDGNKNEANLHEKHSKDLLEEKEKKISDAHKKSRDIVAMKTDAIKEEKNKAINTTKSEMSNFVDSQKNDLANQKNEIYYRLKGNVADLANNITTKLVGDGIAFEPLKENEIDEVIRKHA